MSAFKALLLSFLCWNAYVIFYEVYMTRRPVILVGLQAIGLLILVIGSFAPDLLVRLM